VARKRKIVWSKKIVAAMCSPLFFIATCIGGTLLGAGPLESFGGRDMARGERPDLRMMIVATVPDPAKPGARRVEQVALAALPLFKEKHPEYSLIPPQPEGRVENPLSGMVTDYKVLSSAGGALVETSFRQELLSVRARYLATSTEVKPLYTNSGSVIGALLLGLGLASVLGIIGRMMKYSIQYREARGRFG
jgi:hypothetical protein